MKEPGIIQTDICTYLLHPQPKVTLLFATPEWLVAQATRGYTGVYTREQISGTEEATFWEELKNTKLKGPLEMASTFWLIEDVTRAFTHQFARYRIGVSTVQESQRFSRQVGSNAKIMVPSKVADNSSALEDFLFATDQTMQTYFGLLEADGVETQDARALLPTNICTRLYTTISMTTLAHIYEQRFCCQAQNSGTGEDGEWKQVVNQMKEQLLLKGFSHYAAALIAPWENPRCTNCGFGASFDRPCSYQEKFDGNLVKLYQRLEDKWYPATVTLEGEQNEQRKVRKGYLDLF